MTFPHAGPEDRHRHDAAQGVSAAGRIEQRARQSFARGGLPQRRDPCSVGRVGTVRRSDRPGFYSFRSFGLISPLVGLVCLVFSVGGLIQAKRMRGPKRLALAAIVLSVVIGVVPFLALPFDPS